jgi:N-acetylmuramoyl-L-alanine amidase
MKKFFEAIGNLFRTLFGGGSKPAPAPAPKPRPVVIKPEDAQDGADIKPDTVIMVVSEMDKVIIPPNEPDEAFVKDIFEEAPTPPANPPVTPATPTSTSTTTPATTGGNTSTPTTPTNTAPATTGGSTSTPTAPTTPPKPTTTAPKSHYMWCLDNGHGKKTPGKRSPLFDDGRTRFFEYEFNRDIVQRIREALDKHKIEYYITVPEVDIDDFLKGRVDRANNLKSDLPKIFVSVHANAAPAANSESWSPASGIETWFFHGSKRSQKLASVFQKHLIEKTGFKNRNIKSQPTGQFYVLRNTNMASVLTENGFYNNKAEAAELMKPEVRQKIADAHVAAILEIEKSGL